jgi:hypothetical protein
LRAVMSDMDAPVGARLNAARVVLDMSLKGWSVLEVEDRLSRLEQREGMESSS